MSFCLDREKCGRLARVLLPLVLLLLTGCADQPDAAQPRSARPAGEITGTRTVGQTFVATADDLSRIDVLMATYARRNRDSVIFHLRESPDSSRDIARIEIEAATIEDNKYRTFRFDPIPDSGGRRIYFFFEALEATPGNAVTVWQSDRDVYPDGDVVISGQPGEGDLAFRLYTEYSLGAMLRDAWHEISHRGGVLLLAVVIFWVPGLGLLPLGFATPRERLLAAPALTLSLLPVLFLLIKATGLRLGEWLVWGPVTLGVAVLARRWYQSPRCHTVHRSAQMWWHSDARWPDLALFVVAGLVISVRLLAVRGLVVPLWGDSVQHAVMTQLMVDNGGLFDSWLPYAPYQSLTVHFGFAAAAAALQWVTGLGAAEATLMAGQVINAIAVLSLYPLAVRLAKGNRWAGVGALLVGGLLSPMPAFYVNWGRYAQLTGQAVLPIALWLLWKATETGQNIRQVWKGLLLAGAALTGMVLSYYRMPFFYAAFALAWLLLFISPKYRLDARRWATMVARLASVGLVAGVLVLPWLPNIVGSKLATGLGWGVAVSAPLERVLTDYRNWRDIATYVPWALIVLSGMAVVWAVIRRQWTAVLPAVWALILVALPAGRLVRLPGGNFLQSYAVMIALYIPVSLLIGWLVGQAAASLQRGGWRGMVPGLVVLLFATGWGGRTQITVVQPFFRMVLPADRAAMEWVRENTPLDARFLVNGFTIYDETSSVGSDAGWWIPLLAGRENTMPPQYALFNEEPLTPGHTQAVTQLVRDLQAVSPTSPKGLRLLCQWGVTHAYIGQAQGMVGYKAVPLLPVEELLASPSFELIYQQDQVMIFSLDAQACGDASIRLAAELVTGEQG